MTFLEMFSYTEINTNDSERIYKAYKFVQGKNEELKVLKEILFKMISPKKADRYKSIINMLKDLLSFYKIYYVQISFDNQRLFWERELKYLNSIPDLQDKVEKINQLRLRQKLLNDVMEGVPYDEHL